MGPGVASLTWVDNMLARFGIRNSEIVVLLGNVLIAQRRMVRTVIALIG